MNHGSEKSYSSAWFAFRLNILFCVPVLLKRQLLLSLIHMESLLAIMDCFSHRQSKAEDHFFLAIQASDLMPFHDSRLLVDAITVWGGLLSVSSLPFASQQTVFTFFEAKLIPMRFQDNPQTVVVWKIEAPYSALSEKKLELSVLSVEQFEHCFGSSKCRICSEAFPTQMAHSFCNVTLYFLILLIL